MKINLVRDRVRRVLILKSGSDGEGAGKIVVGSDESYEGIKSVHERRARP